MRHTTLGLIVLAGLALLASDRLPYAADGAPVKQVAVDLSSPQGAIKSLCRAVDAQDGEAVLKVFYAADPGERDLAKAFADLILSGKKLGDAAREQFGSAGDTLGSGVLNQAELARIDQAELRENGDNATLIPIGQSRPLQFHRTGEQWQLIVRDFANAQENLPRQVALLKKVAGVFDDMAQNIDAGKINSSQEAEAAIQTKLANVMIRAATQSSTKPILTPSTRPATRP